MTQNKEYKHPVCKGSITLGTACLTCERCKDELERIRLVDRLDCNRI